MINIEEMEGIKRSYFELSRPFREESRDYYIIYFMGFVIDTIKDLHEENTKLWKAIKEGGWNDSDAPVLSKKDLENLVPDYEYPYEPNE